MTETKRKLYGILGTSLLHSLSPVIYDYLARKYSINGTYQTFEVAEGNLRLAIGGIRTLGISGINVTYPFKEKVIAFLDKLDESAIATGAVNTIKNVNGILVGYNTDVFGIKATLSDRLKVNAGSRNIIIIGAGGAARAALGALRTPPPKKIIILNRTLDRAKKLARDYTDQFPKSPLVSSDFNLQPNPENDFKVDLIINAINTNLALIKHFLLCMDKRHALDDTKFFDLNYGDRAYKGIIPAGISSHTDGLYMLAAQAVKSFQIWHNKMADIQSVYKYLRRKV